MPLFLICYSWVRNQIVEQGFKCHLGLLSKVETLIKYEALYSKTSPTHGAEKRLNIFNYVVLSYEFCRKKIYSGNFEDIFNSLADGMDRRAGEQDSFCTPRSTSKQAGRRR